MRAEAWALLKEMAGWTIGVLLVLYIVALLSHMIGARHGGG